MGDTTRLLIISRQRFVLKRVMCIRRTCTTDAAAKKLPRLGGSQDQVSEHDEYWTWNRDEKLQYPTQPGWTSLCLYTLRLFGWRTPVASLAYRIVHLSHDARVCVWVATCLERTTAAWCEGDCRRYLSLYHQGRPQHYSRWI